MFRQPSPIKQIIVAHYRITFEINGAHFNSMCELLYLFREKS